jgi:hypothetical protein
MRFLYTILFLLAFPVLVLGFRQQFLDHLQAPLAAQVQKVLGTPDFANVRPELNYMDVSLRGEVAQPAQREQARLAVDAIQGLRCREEDNHLQVHPSITGTLTDAHLTLSGWLHSNAELSEVIDWVQKNRPGLEIDQSGVQILHQVTPAPLTAAKEMPLLLQQLQGALQANASLKVVRKDGTFRVTGNLPSMKLRQAIVLAVPLGEGTIPLDFTGLHAGAYVKPAPFADDDALPTLLSVFLTSPGAQSIEASGQELVIRGHATPTMRDRWMAALNRFPEQITVIAGFEVFPSVYHFPSYHPESPLPADKLATLRQALSKTVLQFEKNSTAAAPSQAASLDAASSAIRDAGPEVRIVAGFESLQDESADVTRRRSQAVIDELVGRGVPAKCLEAAPLDSTPSPEETVARAEFLVK